MARTYGVFSVCLLTLCLRVPKVCGLMCVGTIAGVPLHAPLAGQPALLASLKLTSAAVIDPESPGSVILPLAGKVMFAGNAGLLAPLAGTGVDGASSPVLATKASLVGSTRVATTRTGLLIADAISIRRLDSSGQLHLVAGNVTRPRRLTAGSTNSDAVLGSITEPTCFFADGITGDVFFCQGNTVRAIRKTGPNSGFIYTVAGNGSSFFSDGVLATSTGFSDIRDVHTAPNGDLVLAVNDNYNHPRVVRISASDGIARTIIGHDPPAAGVSSITQHTDSDYFTTGTLATKALVGAVAVCVLPSGTLFFTDGTLIGRLSETGTTLTVVAGTVPSKKAPIIYGEPASKMTFYRLFGLRQGATPDELLAADVGVVYRLNLASQTAFAVAGRVQYDQLTPALSKPPQLLLANAIPLPWPYDVKKDAESGDLFATAATGDVVVRVSASDGTMSVIAGTGRPGCSVGGNISDATLADLNHATSVAIDGRGGLIIADRRCCLLRRLNLGNGSLQTLAGLERAYHLRPTSQLCINCVQYR
jgi:hypothetical protein